MIELELIKQKLESKLLDACNLNPQKNKFDIEVEFDGQDSMFCFRGWVNYYDFEIKEISISEAWVQFSNLTAILEQKYIDDIENYFN